MVAAIRAHQQQNLALLENIAPEASMMPLLVIHAAVHATAHASPRTVMATTLIVTQMETQDNASALPIRSAMVV